MSIPGFLSAQRAYENMLPPEESDECEDGDCDECAACIHDRRESEAEDYAEAQREEAHLEERYGQ